MDLSIWDPPEDPDESNTYLANSWQYNLYFDPRLDVIEDDALNEKSCLQVLKIMIKKADSEIAELEDDILMLQRQLACEDDMRFAELNKKIANLDSMLRTLKNENGQPAEPDVESSNLPEEDLNKTEAIDDHNSKDIKTVEFNDGCTVEHAGTTLEDRHSSEQEGKEYSSKPTQKVDMDGIDSPYGMKGQEVVHTETDFTIEDTRPNLSNSEWNHGSYPRKKLKSGGDHYQDKTIMETQQLAVAERAGGFADISTTSQFHLTRSSGAPVIQENKDQRNVRNTLVKSYGRTSQEPLVMHRYSYDYSDVHNVKVAFPMSSSSPSPRIPDINKMSLVQLRALANRHNIYGVSVMRKADLQQLLRSKLPYWS